MNSAKISTILCICIAVMWLLNPSLASHRPVVAEHIRSHLIENYDKWYVPNGAINYCAQQLAGRIERKSYIIFSITRLRNPEVIYRMSLPVDTLTSIGFLGIVF